MTARIMKVVTRKEGNVLVAKIEDRRFDSESADQFQDKMSGFIGSGDRFIVLNLSEVDYIDSRGIGAIVRCVKELGDRGEIVICGPNETIKSTFKLVRMDKLFKIIDSEEEAISVFVS